jgi:hypothetical protein
MTGFGSTKQEDKAARTAHVPPVARVAVVIICPGMPTLQQLPECECPVSLCLPYGLGVSRVVSHSDHTVLLMFSGPTHVGSRLDNRVAHLGCDTLYERADRSLAL